MSQAKGERLYYVLHISGKREALRRMRGFSLLELLVVLALIGLMAGIILPRFSGFFGSLERALERDEIILQINRLGFLAYRQGIDTVLQKYPDNPDKLSLSLPEGWRIETKPPIRYRQNGLCAGGELSLIYEQARYRYQLKAPFCQININR